jgi:polyisoprenoid-binding protein YceI
MLKREVCGGNFEATIDRTQWGLDYGLGMVTGKDVKLIATVEAIKQ